MAWNKDLLRRQGVSIPGDNTNRQKFDTTLPVVCGTQVGVQPQEKKRNPKKVKKSLSGAPKMHVAPPLDEPTESEYKKYVRTGETITIKGEDGRPHILYRIQALVDMPGVFAGELGGYIEREDNLSHFGNCWVHGNAKVYGKARVCENATIIGNAEVSGEAVVFGDASVAGEAHVYGNPYICEKAQVFDNASVSGGEIYGEANIGEYAKIRGGYIAGNTAVYGAALVLHPACLSTGNIGFGTYDTQSVIPPTAEMIEYDCEECI